MRITETKIMRPKPVTLIILDGWGVGPSNNGNALAVAKTPNFDNYFAYFPSVSLQASGIAVGLPWGEVGNSEVGHSTIGTGTVLYQNLPRISIAIQNETFFENREFLKAAEHVKKNNSRLHIMGLASPGNVHASFDHLVALLDFADRQKIKEVFVHAFMDGRDTEPAGGIKYITALQKEMDSRGVGKIATLSGRFYAMDRNNNWDRTALAYEAIVNGTGERATHALSAIQDNYSKNVFDEQFPPTVITDSAGKPVATVNDNDAVIFFNFRADRARQLTKAFVLPGFEKFQRSKYLRNLLFVTMTDYEEALPVSVAFPAQTAKEPLAKVLSDRGFRQLHVAETEKYAHVTYFFNGGAEQPFLNEDRLLVPSKPVKDYDTIPAMSAYEITDKAFEAIKRGYYDFVVMNYANPDMIGHTGNFPATVSALEILDGQVGKIVDLVSSLGGVVFITGDHGNCEQMIDPKTGDKDKEHTANPVPLLMISGFNGFTEPQNLSSVAQNLTNPAGILADVAPTILDTLGIPKPIDMTGESLLPNLMPMQSASNIVVAK
jgi:2,3-bisphosphoglycerate-independent phosphoglycerate mutase